MKTFHVISVTVGTGLLLCFLTVASVAVLAAAVLSVHQKPSPSPMLRPQTGSLGEIESQLNELKFGPVNTNATKEVKNGLFDRFRANRQSRVCASPASQQSVCVSHSTVCQPQPQSIRIADPADCGYSYVVANPVAGQVIVTQPTGLEMPSANPAQPVQTEKDCVACKSPRESVKTGSFICSNCRKSQVGEWHTEWKSDGTPVTFLCERCHLIMTPEQREKAYIGYLSRQSKSAGIAGLLHQEIGQ